MFNYTKERLVIDELIKDRNKLAKGVYTNERTRKQIAITGKVKNADSRINR